MGCDGTLFVIVSGSELFGVAERYADYTYKVCMACGLKVGRERWI